MFKKLTVILLALILIGCKDISSDQFKLKVLNPDQLTQASTLKLKLINPKDFSIDSIKLVDGNSTKKIAAKSVFELQLSEQKLGVNSISVEVFSEDKSVEVKTFFTVYNSKKPQLYTYKIINAYPHDIKAYTQGLEFYKDTLYESTGLRGKSSLRKVNYKTGEIYKKVDLDQFYFGEGLTIFNEKIIQLTYQSNEGLIYNLDMDKIGKFKYNASKEGWGLTHDHQWLYKSDGSTKIWRLDQETFEEVDYIQAVTHSAVLNRLNELEYINGKIYANTYLKDGIVIIDPETGAVEGLIDLRGLKKKVTQHDQLDVLNGIAYNKNTKQLFVTGKNWDKLFEIELIKK
ncbi:MAG: glutaminyl-peptide cyclotransferase [Psychroflexus salarius]